MTSDNNNKKREIDKQSGMHTTGHEWDGIKELDNPTPRWWLWVFYATCIWSFGYWFVYPTWPTLSGEGERGGTKGSIEWTQYRQLKEQQAEIVARKASYLEKFNGASFKEVMNDPEIYAFAVAGGKAAFKDNCATCHGTGGAGGAGYPNLNDDEWIWGGKAEDIYETIKYGVRSSHDDTRISEMPAFGEVLEAEEITSVAEYVQSLSGNGESSASGAVIYEENCASCHGESGKGDREVGAPSLADAIWLYGNGEKGEIASQIRTPKHGVMQNFDTRLSDENIRLLTVYVHSLGGGE